MKFVDQKKGVTELLFYTHIHVWHIYIHLVDSYGKCRWIYQSHGCVMGFLCSFLASENFHREKTSQQKSAPERQKSNWPPDIWARLRLVMKHGTLYPVSWKQLKTDFWEFMHISYIWANHCLLDESFFSWFPCWSQFLMTWININKHTKNYHLHESTSKTSFTACQATFGQVDIMGAPAVAHLITNLTSKSGRFWWNMLSLWSRSKHQILAHPVGFPTL